MYRTDETQDPVFTDTLELDLSTVVPSLAGPKRPQDRVALTDAADGVQGRRRDHQGRLEIQGAGDDTAAGDDAKYMAEGAQRDQSAYPGHEVEGEEYTRRDGDVVIAAITSCTNTSNPSVLIAAGLVARRRTSKGLQVKPWVKTSLAPGSQVVTDYLAKVGLTERSRRHGLRPRRLRLHHLHRQLRPSAGEDLQGHQRKGPRRRARCSRATATSRAA